MLPKNLELVRQVRAGALLVWTDADVAAFKAVAARDMCQILDLILTTGLRPEDIFGPFEWFELVVPDAGQCILHLFCITLDPGDQPPGLPENRRADRTGPTQR